MSTIDIRRELAQVPPREGRRHLPKGRHHFVYPWDVHEAAKRDGTTPAPDAPCDRCALPQSRRRRDRPMSDQAPRRIAVCQHPDGPGEWWPAEQVANGVCPTCRECRPIVYEALRLAGGNSMSKRQYDHFDATDSHTPITFDPDGPLGPQVVFDGGGWLDPDALDRFIRDLVCVSGLMRAAGAGGKAWGVYGPEGLRRVSVEPEFSLDSLADDEQVELLNAEVGRADAT